MSDAPHPKVLLIYTGGTIGMVQPAESTHWVPFNFENLSDQVPELQKLSVDLQAVSFDLPIDSSNMHPDFWVKLVDIIEAHYAEMDGFVVLHGTDTLAYTASALSFMLENLGKPVILTGAQLPIGVIRSDGKENLITAIEIAASRIQGRPRLPEVAIFFESLLLRGNRSLKSSAEQFEAFVSPNYPPLAESGVHIRYADHLMRPMPLSELRVHRAWDNRLAVLTLFPGLQEHMVKSVLQAPELRGLILRTYGAGNAPTEPWFIFWLQQAINRGLVVLNVTQCTTGSVDQGRYETSTLLKDVGVVGGGDLTFEAAVTKLMLLLGRFENRDAVVEALERDLAGEVSWQAPSETP